MSNKSEKEQPDQSSNSKNYWFPTKRNGWGWGLPIRWQGWAAFAIYMALILITTWLIEPKQQQWLWLACFGVYTLMLLAVMWITGEPPRWRWRKKDNPDRWKTW